MGEEKYINISAQIKPDKEWKEYTTETLALVNGFTPTNSIELSKYGGWKKRQVEGKGFFYTKKIKDRWWLVDPEGYLFIHTGIVSVGPGQSVNCQTALKEKYGTEECWADETIKMLKSNGFNGSGAWGNVDLIKNSASPLAYTIISNFMSSYGKHRGGTYQQAGHIGYPNDCIFVFDPEFEEFCDIHARKLAETKEDPYLLGHFSDNEMPFLVNLLDKYLTLEEEDWGYKGAKKWLCDRKGKESFIEDINDEDREAFRGYVADLYYGIVSKAIKKYDPNHLFLGSRFYSSEKNSQSVLRAAGNHLDIISVNYYGVWTPEQETLKNWEKWSGKPVMITEWYTKGEDTGMKNTSGAGWIVKTQEERGLFYQNFTLALLKSKVCVGWHWFKYIDNDPEDLTTDPSNRDSNKGIVNIKYQEYTPLLYRMKELNNQVYELTDYFDQ